MPPIYRCQSQFPNIRIQNLSEPLVSWEIHLYYRCSFDFYVYFSFPTCHICIGPVSGSKHGSVKLFIGVSLCSSSNIFISIWTIIQTLGNFICIWLYSVFWRFLIFPYHVLDYIHLFPSEVMFMFFHSFMFLSKFIVYCDWFWDLMTKCL